MRGISKSFRGVAANDAISLSIATGEILGFLGENGAGKTTLMNILYGLYQPEAGEIRINGDVVHIRSPLGAIALGIGMVHQHFMLVQNHSALENIALGYRRTPFFFPQKKLRNVVFDLSHKFNFALDPMKMIWELSAGEQQRVEILKALLNGADLMILDEPTSVLTPTEAADLFETLRRMKAAGHLVILISHKLDEILSICDRVLVLRKGRVVGEAAVAGVNKIDLARMMVGREVLFDMQRDPVASAAPVLDVDHVTVHGDKGVPAIRDLSFCILESEIFGIAGVSGNGQRELAEAVTGLRRVEAGRVVVRGLDMTNQGARAVFDAGVAHVPEERMKLGIAPGLPLYENAVLKQHHRTKFFNRFLMAQRALKQHARQVVSRFQVAAPAIDVQTNHLSGGNIQKLILGRELSENPTLLVASHPTYGLDVGATEYLRRQLLLHRKRGGAVLLISEDLEEIMGLCDRIAVLFHGEFMGILKAEDANLQDIGLMMAGAARASSGSAPGAAG